jgi:hypothetical protein
MRLLDEGMTMVDQVASQTNRMDTGNSSSAAQPNPAEARRRLSDTFRAGELVWLVREQYDLHTQAWLIDVVRQGTFGRWMQQRYRFDEQADVLYFLGEHALNDDEFRHLRNGARIFPVVATQA